MKLMISGLLLGLACTSGYSQFNENGYKNLKLGMSTSEVKKIANFKIQDDQAEIIYNNIKFELSFADLDKHTLYSIKTSSPNAKLEGVSQNLIGKKLKEVKSILGNKLSQFDAAGPSTKYYIYYRNKDAKNNEMTSCVLEFDDNGVLESIFSAYNP